MARIECEKGRFPFSMQEPLNDPWFIYYKIAYSSIGSEINKQSPVNFVPEVPLSTPRGFGALHLTGRGKSHFMQA